jgi:hypothetical protein
MHKNGPVRRVMAFSVISLLFFLLPFACEDNIKTGILMGGGITFDINNLDQAARDTASAMNLDGRALDVKLADGTEVQALCAKDQWDNLCIGQTITIRPIENSQYWLFEKTEGKNNQSVEGNCRKLPVILGSTAYSEYFPLDPGTEWTFAVDIPEGAVPARYREVYWPMDKATDYWITSVAKATLKKTNPSAEFIEHFRIKGNAPADRLPEVILRNGIPEKIAELEIIRDDILLYQYAAHVYWLQCPSTYEDKPLSVIDEVMIIDKSYFPYNDRPKPIGDGFCRRSIFMTAGIGLTLSHNVSGQENPDSLTFKGPVAVNGDTPTINLGFERRIASDEPGQEIIEECTYGVHRGLVELSQTVGGQRTMHWTLMETPK